MPLLTVKSLHARVAGADTEILRGLDLTVNTGEIHAIMGPNGSGKSTFANVLAGRPDYAVTGGEIEFNGEQIAALPPEDRALRGMFLAFQYPAEIPGVRPWQFLKAALDARSEFEGKAKMSVRDFSKMFDAMVKETGIRPDLIQRSLNEGFSGGEKKRNEVLQLKVLRPKLAVMDETDSGLDVDALRSVAEGINSMRGPERAFIIVTHYQRILSYVRPDFVHILAGGRIVQSGGAELAHEVEKTGYEKYAAAASPAGR
jgi:Fe-S cluster assembly ATP-binding protein